MRTVFFALVLAAVAFGAPVKDLRDATIVSTGNIAGGEAYIVLDPFRKQTEDILRLVEAMPQRRFNFIFAPYRYSDTYRRFEALLLRLRGNLRYKLFKQASLLEWRGFMGFEPSKRDSKRIGIGSSLVKTYGIRALPAFFDSAGKPVKREAVFGETLPAQLLDSAAISKLRQANAFTEFGEGNSTLYILGHYGDILADFDGAAISAAAKRQKVSIALCQKAEDPRELKRLRWFYSLDDAGRKRALTNPSGIGGDVAEESEAMAAANAICKAMRVRSYATAEEER